MAYENGVDWRPLAPEARGRFRTFPDAVRAAFKELYREQNPFFAQIVDRWGELFPQLRARPLRFEDGVLYLAVRNAPTAFGVRPKLAGGRRVLSALPGAPADIKVKLEICAC